MNSIFDSSPRRPYRVLLTSDLHLTDIDRDYFGTTSDERLQAWANNVLAEHEKHPFDLIVIAGDVSLDYWGWNGGGSFQRTPSQCDTARFMENMPLNCPKASP